MKRIHIQPLHIFPFQRKYLTSNHLLFSISDTERQIKYEIIDAPLVGRLMMESDTVGIFKVVNSFSQVDVNASKVFYEHTHEFEGLYTNDSFLFNVKSHLAQPLLNQVGLII